MTAASERRRLEPRRARRARRRRLGPWLMAFGVSGLLLLGLAAGLVLASMAAVNDAVTGFERQRTQILGMIQPAADALSTTATSASNAGESLTRTRDAAANGANLATRMADSFDSMASLGSISIFGTRPFASAAEQFAAVAADARTLATNLRSTADAVDTNIADSAAAATSLRALATELEGLEEQLQSGTPAISLATQVVLGQLVLLALLAWVAIPAVASIWLGRRWGRADPT